VLLDRTTILSSNEVKVELLLYLPKIRIAVIGTASSGAMPFTLVYAFTQETGTPSAGIEIRLLPVESTVAATSAFMLVSMVGVTVGSGTFLNSRTE
jgi:hypothetical protein